MGSLMDDASDVHTSIFSIIFIIKLIYATRFFEIQIKQKQNKTKKKQANKIKLQKGKSLAKNPKDLIILPIL